MLVRLGREEGVPIVGLNYKEIRGDAELDASRLSPQEEREAALKGVRLLAFTKKTLANRVAHDAELARIREQGYGLDDEEHEEGIHCIGAPVFDHTGSIVATISVSWPGFRYKREEESAKIDKIKTARGEKVTDIEGLELDHEYERKSSFF